MHLLMSKRMCIILSPHNIIYTYTALEWLENNQVELESCCITAVHLYSACTIVQASEKGMHAILFEGGAKWFI